MFHRQYFGPQELDRESKGATYGEIQAGYRSFIGRHLSEEKTKLEGVSMFILVYLYLFGFYLCSYIMRN